MKEELVLMMGVVKIDDKYKSIAKVSDGESIVINESKDFDSLQEAISFTSVGWILAARIMISPKDANEILEELKNITTDDGALVN